MNTLERGLWRWLKAGKPADVHAQRIENSAVRGTPDAEACGRGRTAWIELKIGRERKDGWGFEHLTSQQALWHWHRNRAGGTSWLLVQVGVERLLIPGRAAEPLYRTRRCVTKADLTALGGVTMYSAADTWAFALRPPAPDVPPP